MSKKTKLNILFIAWVVLLVSLIAGLVFLTNQNLDWIFVSEAIPLVTYLLLMVLSVTLFALFFLALLGLFIASQESSEYSIPLSWIGILLILLFACLLALVFPRSQSWKTVIIGNGILFVAGLLMVGFAYLIAHFREIHYQSMLQHHWDEWKLLIEQRVSHGESISPEDINRLPRVLRNQALERYAIEEDAYVYDPSSKTLAVRNLARIREFDRDWHQARVFAEKDLLRPSNMSTQLQREQTQLQNGAKLGEKNWAEISKLLLGRISEALDMSFEKKEEISDRLVVFIIDAYPLFEGLPVPSAIPVIFAGEAPLTLSQIEVIRSYLIAHQTELGKMALLSVLGSPETISRVRTMVRNKIRDPFAFDVIVLGKQNWLDFFTSSESQTAFRKLVLSEFDLRTLSPFVISGPALDNMFFGREHELREITERITTSNYILIGGRRMGKTSILKRLERVHLPAANFCALYHDCSYTSNLRELTEAISRDKSWFTQPPAIDLTSFADIVTALPQEDDIVILLDEADGILAADQNADYKFSTTLRAMANKGYCRFVLSGGRALHTEIANPASPLYNFGNEILVGRLDFHDVEELIIRPIEQLEIKLEDKNGIVKQIWSLTSGHPNIVQRFCQRLIVRLNNRRDRDLSMGDIEAVATDQDFLRKDFLNVYWERATVLERLCSLVMAADQDARTLTRVHEALNSYSVEVTLNQVDDALERLVDLRNILERTVKGYEFAVTAFPEVIAKTARLDDLIALNCEAYRLHGDVVPESYRGAK